MLVVRMEIWPGGDESRKREIGRANIANVGGDSAVGDYDYVVVEGATLVGKGRWCGHNRMDGATRLVSRILHYATTGRID